MPNSEKDPTLLHVANKMASEVDRRIRKGEIDFTWMEEYFYDCLLETARDATVEEREMWEKDR